MSKKNVILSSTIFIQTLSSQIFFRFVDGILFLSPDTFCRSFFGNGASR